MQSYEEYMTQGGFAESAFRQSYNRTTIYSGMAQKPLHTRRKRFVAMVSTFLAVQLVVSIALVVRVAVSVKRGRSSAFVSRRDCADCDVWCAANCSHLGVTANDQWSSKTFNVSSVRENAMSVMCCIRRSDLLSKIYEESVSSQSEAREKLFDGARVIDLWREDDTNRWPKIPNPSILYFKSARTFRIQADGTYFVHSRIDFNCSRADHSYYNQTIYVRNESHPNYFEDNRIDLSKTGPGNSRRSTIYTSSIDVMVELTKGDQLEMLTDPYNCTSPRSIVVYRLQDV